MVKIILGVISSISLTTPIFLLLKQLKNRTRQIDAIEHGNSCRKAPQEEASQEPEPMCDSSFDSLVEEENSGDPIYDNFEVYRR